MTAISIALRREEEQVRPGDLAVIATFTNEGADATRLNLHQASHPALVLQVQDAGGKAIHFQPPSAPDEEDLARGHLLEPGETLEIRYAGFLDHGLPGGTYRIRYFSPFPELGGTADAPLASEWLNVEVVSATLPKATIRELGLGRPRPVPAIVAILKKVLKKLLCLLLRVLGRACRRTLQGDVDEQRTETISEAPPGSEAWNGTYAWRARFNVTVNEPRCRVDVVVRIRVNGAITDAQRTAWGDAISAAWSNRFKLCCGCCCCQDGYVIHARADFVDSDEHQVVNAGTSTTNMGNWGVDDTVDVGHEFGHMLGALDEYFTVNGVRYGAGRQPDGNIMNNPANDPAAGHYDLVRAAAAGLLRTTCRTVPVGERC